MTQKQMIHLIQRIKNFQDKRILVVGDVMLDEYMWGSVKRISPEAPVPVVNVDKKTYMAGGAGNTAANISALGGNATIAGIIGDDTQGALLRQKLGELGIETSGLIMDSSHPTITKTRIIANKQHVVRVDVEKRYALGSEIREKLLQTVESTIGTVQAVVISDYGKHVVTAEVCGAVISMAQKHNIPVIADPKGNEYAKYRGATIITPNILETEKALNIEISGEAELIEAGNELNRFIGGSAILITRGPEGMSLFVNGGKIVHFPAVARALYDVTGAGDTVVSTLAMSLAANASLEDAVYLSNLAAGLAVEKLGTATVTVQELRNVLEQAE